MPKHDPLVDHALVLSQVHPHVIGHRSERTTLRDVLLRSGADPEQVNRLPLDQNLDLIGAGEPIIITGAPHHVGEGRFLELPWPCGCGQPLHADPERLLRVWARHTAQATGIDPDHLEEHPLVALRGARPVASCLCGRSFTSSDEDPLNSNLALDGWEHHVREDRS
jgi:hypothetical protein